MRAYGGEEVAFDVLNPHTVWRRVAPRCPLKRRYVGPRAGLNPLVEEKNISCPCHKCNNDIPILCSVMKLRIFNIQQKNSSSEVFSVTCLENNFEGTPCPLFCHICTSVCHAVFVWFVQFISYRPTWTFTLFFNHFTDLSVTLCFS